MKETVADVLLGRKITAVEEIRDEAGVLVALTLELDQEETVFLKIDHRPWAKRTIGISGT